MATANEPEKATHINLSATASTLLPNDEAVVLFRIEASGNNPSALRKKVNTISQNIQALFKQEKGIKQQTLSRRMEMLWRYDNVKKRQVRNGWKLSQRQQLSSKRIDAVSKWVDGIEKAGAHLDSLGFRVSDKAMKQAQATLRLQAIQTFRQKAMTFAKALDAKSFHILNLQTSNRQPVYRKYRAMPEMAMMAKSADAPAPSFNAGDGKVSITVSGTLALPYVNYMVK
jgi:predicted secreted protein